MIELTKDNIDVAIVNKAFDMVKRSELGYVFTNETICTFNTMLIFRDLFNNKCRMLDKALENLYYIADKIFECLRPSDNDKYYKVTVVTNPSTAQATINGFPGKERTLVSGSDVTIVAKLDGYYDKTETIENLSKDTTVNIAFTEEDKLPRYFAINVTTVPANALCKINGEVTKSANLKEGSTCSIEVTADGYISYRTSFVVTSDRNLTVSLNKVPVDDIIITVNPTPSDAIVTIDGVQGNTRIVKVGNHTIKVTKSGFVTYNLQQYFSKDTTLTPELKIAISVKSTPTDASISIDGRNVSSAEVYPGEHTIIVSKSGYKTYSITREFTISETVNVTLEQEVSTARLTVTATPTPNVITLDGEQISSKVVPIGTRVNIVVTKEGYITYNEIVTVDRDITKEIVLKNTVSVNVVAYKSDKTDDEAKQGVTINYTIEDDTTVYTFENDTIQEMPINKNITFVASANGYATETRERNFVGTYSIETISIPLNPESPEPPSDYLLTVNTIPSDAEVTIDGVSGKSQRVSSGEHTIVVSKTGYTTVTRTITITSDTEITITLQSEAVNPVLTVIATPNNATIMIDGEVRSSKSVTPGTQHTIVVSLSGYATYTNTVTVNEDMTVEVTLKNTKTVIFDAYKTDVETSINRQGVTVEVNYSGGSVVYEQSVPFTLEIPSNVNVTITAKADGYIDTVENRTFNASYESETIVLPLEPKPVVPKIRVEVDDTSYEGGTITMNGVEQKVGYYDKGDKVLIVCNKQGYTPCICYLTANEDIVIPIAYSQYFEITTPGQVTLRVQAIRQRMIRPITGATFMLDDNTVINTGQEYVVDASTHKLSTSTIANFLPEEFTYYYQYNADVYFYLIGS